MRGLSQIEIQFNQVVSILFFFFLFSTQSTLNGQKVGISNSQLRIDRVDGKKAELSQSAIYTIHQDFRGMLWIGNQAGLERFDGLKFTLMDKSYMKNSEDEPIGTVLAIAEDTKRATLWIGAMNGLFQMNLNDFTIEKKYDRDSLLQKAEIQTLYFHQDILWIGTQEKLFQYDVESKFPTAISTRGGSDISSIVSFDNTIFLGCKQGVYKITSTDTLRIHMDNWNSKDSLEISAFEIVPSIGLLVGTKNNGVFRLDSTQTRLHQLILPKNIISEESMEVTAMLSDTKNNFWIGTRHNGLIMIENFPDRIRSNNPISEETMGFHHESKRDENTQLRDDVIWSLTETKDGIIWIGTNEDGLNYHDPSYIDRFEHHLSSYPNNNIWAIFKDISSCSARGNTTKEAFLWLGTSGSGLIRYNLHHAEPLDTFKTKPEDGFENAYVITQVGSSLFVGTEHGIWKLSLCGSNNVLIRDDYLEKFNDKAVISLFYDTLTNHLLIGTINNGLFKSEVNNRGNIIDKPEGVETSSGQRINFIGEANDQFLWIGTEYGLERLDRSLSRIESLSEFEGYYIYYIYSENDSTYWLSARGKYQFLKFSYNKKNDNFNIDTKYTKADGLTSKIVYSILPDFDNNLWLSTNNGIFQFEKKKQFWLFDTSVDEFQSNEFNRGAFHSDKKMKSLYFGGINGLTSIQLSNENTERDINLDLSVFEFKYSNDGSPKLESVIAGNLNEIENTSITLDKSTEGVYIFLDNFSFYLNRSYLMKITIKRPGEDQEEYIIDPINRNQLPYLPATAIRSRSFFPKKTSVKIEIKLFGSSNDEIKFHTMVFARGRGLSPSEAKLTIFAILTTALILISLVLLYRSEKIKRTNTLLTLNSLNQGIREHFLKNALSHLGFFILHDDIRERNKHFEEFSDLFEMALKIAKSGKNSLKEEIEFLNDFVNFEKSKRGLDFDFSITRNVSEETLKIPSFMLQPLVENAIEHGLADKEGERRLSLDLTQDGRVLKCVLTDNGIGRKKKNLGNGTTLVKERLQLVKKVYGPRKKLQFQFEDVGNDHAESSGLRVYIDLPILKK